MPVGAGIAVAGTVAGAAISSDAARSAANKQSDAAQNAASASLKQFNTINNQQAPYREAGYGALSALNNYLGIAPGAPKQSEDNFDAAAYLADPANADVLKSKKYRNDPYQHYLDWGKAGGRTFTGNDKYRQELAQQQAGSSAPGFGQFTHQFDANDLNANLAPNYDFMLKQGQGQTANTINSTGGLLSGNAQQGLNTFTQNYAKNAYQDAFNNYTTNQNNIYTRLAGLAGFGQNSLQQSNAAGTAATNSANNYLTSGAAAQAAGTVGQANALSGATSSLGTLGAYYGMAQ